MKSIAVLHRAWNTAWLAALAATFSLAGCTLPRNAPLLTEVEAAGNANTITLSPITADIVEASRNQDRHGFPAAFLSAKAFEYSALGPGDGVDITIWERDGMNIFPSADGGGASKIGEIVLDGRGDIQVPYAGTIHAQGVTPAQLRDTLIRRLSKMMMSFDVTVNATARKGQTVSVQGDLQKPGVYPIGQGMTRLGDLLALAAPNQANAKQLEVIVRRHGASGSVRLSDVYRDNAVDIALLPGDSVILSNVIDRMYVLGAAGIQGSVKLTRRNFTLLDALGDSRALSDTAANPHGVFLMRSHLSGRPVVYRFDFTLPDQIALAGRFVVRDGDALLLSDAPFTQVQKVLSTFSATLGTARSVSAISN